MATVVRVTATPKKGWWVVPMMVLGVLVGYVPFCKPIAKLILLRCMVVDVRNG